MIAGKVTARREARLRLTVIARDNQEHLIEVVLDNGFLTLPTGVIRALRLPLAGNRRVILGDGSSVVLDSYAAWVLWHERGRRVLVLQADGDPVIGMSLLHGSRVVLDVLEDGDVTIDPLP
jgi:predicted aspartyl protease